MLKISENQIVTVNRGDTFSIPFLIYLKNSFDEVEYKLKDNDTVYFRVMNCNTPWEKAEIKKEYTKADLGANDRIFVNFKVEDTIGLLPGKYYYEVKLKHKVSEEQIKVDTIVTRRQFIILE